MNTSRPIRTIACTAAAIALTAGCASSDVARVSEKPTKTSIEVPPTGLPIVSSTLAPAALPPTTPAPTLAPIEVNALPECTPSGLQSVVGPPPAGYTYDYVFCAVSNGGRSFVSWADVPNDPMVDGAQTIAEFKQGQLVVLNSGTAGLCDDGVVPNEVIEPLNCA
jgi:hypothetical protein